MSDIIDDANDHVEKELTRTLSMRKPEGPVATGLCLFCEHQLVDDETLARAETDGLPDNTKRWCDSDCRDDWEREQRRM